MMAVMIVAAASMISGLLTYLRLRRVDLVSALKTGE
jgi:hypothetical protein